MSASVLESPWLERKSLLGRLARLPLRLIPRRAVVPVLSGANRGRKWIVGSSVHGCWIGVYERPTQEMLRRLARPGMVAWDVGANAGFYTLALASAVGASGHVYAFEPFAENAQNVLRHIRLNDITNAGLVQAALGSASGVVPFQVAESNLMGRIGSSDTGYLVPCISADDFVARFPKAMPDFMKVDIEGAESSMLEGARRVLDHGPAILLSLHGLDQAAACLRILAGHGYTAYRMDGAPVGGNAAGLDQVLALRDKSAAAASREVSQR